jgi:hypothetical protein
MGRPRRIQFAGACALIALRGNNRQDLFRTSSDRRQFLALLKAAKERHGLKVYAYSLLNGRVDLLIETARANLSVVMQELCARYTKRFNRAHHSTGHVFQGRYRSWIVDKDARLADMTRYVHLACAREGLPGRPWRHPWTSCAAYVEAELKDSLVDTAPVLRKFGGGTRLAQSVRYLRYVQERMRNAVADELPAAGGVVGGEAFLAKLAERRDAPPQARPDGREAARRVVAEVCARRGVAEEKVMSKVQWRDVSAARREAVHRLWKDEGLGVSELARLFSRTPSAISQLLRAVEESKN